MFNYMYKQLIYPFMLLICTVLLTACPKSEPAPQSTVKDKLMKQWKVARVTQAGNATPLYQNPLPAGQSNVEDYSNFRLSITPVSDYMLIQRDNSIRTGTWELASNETKIVLDKNIADKEAILDIVELTDASLKVSILENSTKTGNRQLQMDFVPLQ